MKKFILLLCLNCLFYFSNIVTFSQTVSTNLTPSVATTAATSRKIAILDVTNRGTEIMKNVYSLEYICKTAGIPYFITTSVATAVTYPIVIVSSDIDGEFTKAETTKLIAYVNSGGVLVAPWVDDATFNTLFGISDAITTRKHHRLTFKDSTETAFRWMNDTLEKTISLGSTDYPNVMYSCSYKLTTAKPIATYPEDGTVGVARNTYGAGVAYCLGFSFQSMIFAPQQNYDWESQRTWDNGFEPTSDVVMLFIKGLYAKYIKYSAWKHTAPYNNTPIFIFTHDIDCKVAMLSMNHFADWEKANNIHATYFVTTHYVSDWQDSDYYTPYFKQLDSIKNKSFEIGSHSVCHAPDFASYPVGVSGNTQRNYNPRYINGATVGGSIFGECEVSKKLLTNNIGATVTSFRPGYLYIPDSLDFVLDKTGYKFSSCNSANDVLTNFPFYAHKVKSYSSPLSKIIEIPAVLFYDPTENENYDSTVNTIMPILKKIYDNYAPAAILIHPTYNYKLDIEKDLVSRLSKNTSFMNINEFGDYWGKRNSFGFSSVLSNNDTKLVITIPDSCFPVDPRMNIVVSNGQKIPTIIVQRANGTVIRYLKSNFEANDLLIYFSEMPTMLKAMEEPPTKEIVVPDLTFVSYPNPFNSQTTIDVNLPEDSNVDLQIYDINGRLITTLVNERMEKGSHQIVYAPKDLENGIYFCRLQTDKKQLVIKIVKM